MTKNEARQSDLYLVLGAIGIVFGDIGTSPMYAMNEALSALPSTQIHNGVLGVASLIIWSLIIIVCIKYLFFITHANNDGEGGIFAIVTMLKDNSSFPNKLIPIITIIGITSAALLFSDSIITPALSIMAAVEGTKVIFPQTDNLIIPISLVVVMLLFAIQKYGTSQISKFFGPVMLLWFAVIGFLGIKEIIYYPGVLKALSPEYAIGLLAHLHWNEIMPLLSAVLLAVTGAEAIYADMGHFGRAPISIAWYAVAIQGILLNYLGQAAKALQGPLESNAENLFFQLVPIEFMLPVVIIATLASVIASQAVITGMFSISKQAIQLGYLPRLKVDQTSEHRGQIYIPVINALLLIGCILLIIGFRSSSALASAYGFAVAATMFLTTAAFSFVTFFLWKWSKLKVIIFCIIAIPIDLIFLISTITKLPAGYYLSGITTGIIIWLLYSWIRVSYQVTQNAMRIDIPINLFCDLVEQREDLTNISRPAVFLQHLASDAELPITPNSLLRQIQVTSVIYNPCIIAEFIVENTPRVLNSSRIEHIQYKNNISHIRIKYGFLEDFSVGPLVEYGTQKGWWNSEADIIYYSCKEEIRNISPSIVHPFVKIPFVWLHKFDNSVSCNLDLPSLQYVELGARIDL